MSNLDLFEIEVENITDSKSLKFYPASLFQEMEEELSQKLFNNESTEDSTDGPLNFIEGLVNNLQEEFDETFETLGRNTNRKLFVRSLTKIFMIRLSVKADNAKKTKQIVKIAIKTVLKLWSGQN